ncbi:hypothetical protein GCM10022419_055080 [Nonomuraea rosea]|uniref:Gfo/Idh/MocA-like oxidoreductase C-terminal domain-containing protein n=1 Tax=Nonomuraea rosea TaxID=638574 RepID=A0ABP6XHU6_9ACTN
MAPFEKAGFPVFSEVAKRYDELVSQRTWENMACTVTLPDHGVLTVEDAVRRLGLDAAMLRTAREVEPEDLELQQVGAGVVTWSNNPYLDGKEVTDRIGGAGFRHWSLSGDIEGNTTLYASYGESKGQLQFPEPYWLPFVPWTEQIGPLAPYAERFAAVYDTWSGEPETWSDNPEVSALGTCLAVIELESGVRLDKEISRGPRTYVPMPR